MISTIDAMDSRALMTVIFSGILACSCSKNSKPDPTGLLPRMTREQVVEIMGNPTDVKPAGQGKEIYIYRDDRELIHVFLVNGRIKNIEHVRRRQIISR